MGAAAIVSLPPFGYVISYRRSALFHVPLGSRDSTARRSPQGRRWRGSRSSHLPYPPDRPERSYLRGGQSETATLDLLGVGRRARGGVRDEG